MPLPPAPAVPYPGLSMSGLEIIKASARMCHVLAGEDELTGGEANDMLGTLNRQMDAFMADKLAIFTKDIQDFLFVVAKQTYTLGTPGGDFDTVRPPNIERMSVVLTSNLAVEIALDRYSLDDWQAIRLKTTTSSFPLGVYDDNAFPLRNLSFWPTPGAAHTFRMYSWVPLTQFPDLKTTASFPPGYAEAIIYNLALRISDEFHGELGQTIVEGAARTLQAIKVANVEMTPSSYDGMFQGSEKMSGGRQMDARMKAALFGLPY
jgi:hypothetical protein